MKKRWKQALIIAAAVGMLAGCGRDETAETEEYPGDCDRNKGNRNSFGTSNRRNGTGI